MTLLLILSRLQAGRGGKEKVLEGTSLWRNELSWLLGYSGQQEQLSNHQMVQLSFEPEEAWQGWQKWNPLPAPSFLSIGGKVK